ncbi:hypothetical protein GOODEAATRI_029775 [Goodea atripinnis]|uniref:Uncharacterized protein n=1 Tax=Goodea atripinnis TaxID=208336 RepID=A0ABV0Q313_9TELE
MYKINHAILVSHVMDFFLAHYFCLIFYVGNEEYIQKDLTEFYCFSDTLYRFSLQISLGYHLIPVNKLGFHSICSCTLISFSLPPLHLPSHLLPLPCLLSFPEYFAPLRFDEGI